MPGFNKNRICLLVALMLLTAKQPAFAQAVNIKTYSAAEGFKGSSVQHIFRDSQGYLWISTYADLLRFDGTSFYRFGAKDGLSGSLNTILFEDSKHTLWGTSHNKVIHFYNGSFSALPFDAKDSVDYIFSFYETAAHLLYVCTSRGVFALAHNRFSKINAGITQPMFPVRNIIRAEDHSLLFCTPFYLLRKNGSEKAAVIADTSVTEQFNKIIPLANSVLVVGFDGLFIYDFHSLKKISGVIFINDFIIAAAPDHYGGIYACGINAGLYYFKNGRIQHIQTGEDLSFGFVHSICEDREGNTWIGSLKLFRMRTSCITHFTKADGMESTDTRSVLFTKRGAGYLGQNAFTLWNGKKFTPAAALLNPAAVASFENHIPYFLQDDDQGRIWMMLNPNRLVRYSNHTLEDLNPAFNPQHQGMGQIIFDPADSSIYIALDSVIRIKKEHLVEKIPVTINHHSEKPSVLCFDHQHRLWIGTKNGNTGYVDLKNKQFKEAKINYNNGATQKIICAADGTIWAAGSSYGIAHYAVNKEGNIVLRSVINESNDLPSNSVWDIVFDKKGFLWATTTDGLIRYKIAATTNSDAILSSHNFGIDDGLNPSSFVDSHLGMDSTGHVWMVTYDGVYRIDENNMLYDSLAPKVQVEKIAVLHDSTNGNGFAKVADTYFHLPVKPVFSYDKNTITIYFNSLAYARQEEVQCQYKLQGFDDTWINSTAAGNASYVNLPAGAYTFHVRARRKNFSWSREALFAFTIKPPYWQRWWFHLLVILLASSILLIAFRIRIRQINRKASVQQQMQQLEMQALKARMNPHFIYNAMNSIQSLIMSNEPESAVRYLGKFAKLLRQVLDNSDQQLIPLARELSSLRLYIELETLRLHLDFDYTIHVDDDIDTAEEFVPPLTLQPFVENALWHGLSNKAGSKKLVISLSAQQDYLLATITDNGIGRVRSAAIKSKSANTNTSKGLGITARRLSLLDKNNIQPVVTEDLFNEKGDAAGTKVILRIQRSLPG